MALSLLSSLILFSSLSFGTICKSNPKEEKKIELNLQKNSDVLNNFAFSPKVKNQAEKMLSMLITAKSPMITNWIKLRNIDSNNNPELVAVEWDKYFSKNFVIARYPTGDKDIDTDIVKTIDKLIKINFTLDVVAKLEDSFLKVKNLAINLINNYPLSEADKKYLVLKVNQIKLYWPTSFVSSKFLKFPMELIEWSLAYDPKSNEINIGLNALNYNDQSLRAALMHEIAHSFDSCRWSQMNSTPWPFTKIGECLRTIAFPRDDSKLESMYKSGKITNEQYVFMTNNKTCNNSIYPPIGVQSDQLPETFADWFSAEGMSKDTINSEFRNDLCVDQVLNAGSSYLKNTDRLFSIYLANPILQTQVHEVRDVKYCSFK